MGNLGRAVVDICFVFFVLYQHTYTFLETACLCPRKELPHPTPSVSVHVQVEWSSLHTLIPRVYVWLRPVRRSSLFPCEQCNE